MDEGELSRLQHLVVDAARPLDGVKRKCVFHDGDFPGTSCVDVVEKNAELMTRCALTHIPKTVLPSTICAISVAPTPITL